MLSIERSTRRVARIPLLVLLISGAFGLACIGAGISAELGGDLGFSSMLRPDLGPLSDENIRDDQRTFSDGSSPKRPRAGLISELVPIEMTPSELQRLRRADTFWILGGRVDLSYELTVTDPRIGGEPLTYSTGFGVLKDSGDYASVVGWHPYYRFTDPITRRLAFFQGEYFRSPYVPEVTGYTVVLRTCKDASSVDPNGSPGRLDSKCEDEEVGLDLCLTDTLIADSTWFPYTVMRCGVVFLGDASMTLEAIDIETNQNVETSFRSLTHRPRPLYPNLRQVQNAPGGARTLARSLRFDQEECIVESVLEPDGRPCLSLDEDPGDGTKYLQSEWSWQVEEDPSTGWWVENFSPRLIVTRVFLFVQKPGMPGLAGREYLLPDGIRKLKVIGEEKFGISDDFKCPVSVDEETGRAYFDMTACDENAFVTPTYDHAQLVSEVTERLLWNPRFRVTALGATFPSELPVDRSEDLFIEFEVMGISTAQSSNGLTLSPAGYDFGPVERGAKDARERAIRIANVGTLSQTITELRLEGPNADDYSAFVTVGQQPPFTLAPGKSVDLTLVVSGEGSGNREADLHVIGQNVGAPFDFYAVLRSSTVYADAKLAPTTMGIEAPAGWGLLNPTARTRRFLIESVGLQDLEVFSVRIEGRDAAHFSVLESSSRGREWDIQGLPYPAPTSIAPGYADFLSVIYHPQAPTSADFHRAEVVIEHAAGTSSIDLWGDCLHAARDCDYDLPPALGGP